MVPQGCFQILAIVTSAAVNIGVHIFFWMGVSGSAYSPWWSDCLQEVTHRAKNCPSEVHYPQRIAPKSPQIYFHSRGRRDQDQGRQCTQGFYGSSQKVTYMTSTQMSLAIGQNSIPWLYLTAMNNEKCDLENKELDFSSHIVVPATHMCVNSLGETYSINSLIQSQKPSPTSF